MVEAATVLGGRHDPPPPRAARDEQRAVAGLFVAGGGLLLAAGCYLAVAYLPRHVGTPKLRLDQLGTWPVTVGGFAGLLALASLCHLAAWRLATRLRPTRGRVAFVCVVAALISLTLLPTYPLLSDDLFYSIFGGRILARYGENPFLLPPAHFAADPFLPYTGWRRITTPYGPLWVLLSGGLSRLAGDGVLVNILAFKTLAMLAFMAATALVAFILRRLAPAHLLPGLILWGWNPLVLLESAASGHNDVVMVVLILLALALALRSRPIPAVLALTLAVALKFVAIVLLPLLVAFLLGRRCGRGGRIRALLVAGLVSAGALAALFAPFWVGWRTLGFLGEARFFYGSPIALARLLLEGWQPGGWSASTRDRLLQGGALLGYAAVYPLLLREAGRGGTGLVRACYVALLLTLCAWPFFMPWYALWPLALAAVLARGAGARQALAFGSAALATYLAQFGLRQASPHPVAFWSALAALLAFGTLLATGSPWLWRAVSQGAARARRRPPRARPRRGSGSRPGGRGAAISALQDAAVLTLATLVALVPRRRSPRRGPPGRVLAVIVAMGVLIALVGDIRRVPLPAIDPLSSSPPGVSGGHYAMPTSVLPQPPRGAALVPLYPPTVAPAATYATPGRTSQPAPLPPNELGLVPILMYHTFLADSTSVWNRTPSAFRGDLEYLYAHGYYLTAMHQFITGDLNIPAGKTPVILTFDDGAESQFRFLVHPDGTTSIDPDSAVGILEDMTARHPDFGRAGVFYVPPLLPFGDDDDKHDQRRFAGEKLAWLLARGYELGNHTLHHANLATATDGQIIQEIAGGADGLHRFVPDAPLETIALPFGAYPDHGDPALLRHCTYRGHTYGYRAVLLVGAEAAPSPFDRRRDLFFTPRIRATDAELGKWFGAYLDRYPAVRYVSDGDPATVTIPVTLTPALRDKFDPARLGGRRLVRYGP